MVQNIVDSVMVLGESMRVRWRCAEHRHASPCMVALGSWRTSGSRQSSRENTNVGISIKVFASNIFVRSVGRRLAAGCIYRRGVNVGSRRCRSEAG